MSGKSPNPRTKLLNAALRVIRSKGYAGSSVDDICREAGVTKGSFFHHFKGKDDLAICSVQHWTAVTGELFATAPFRAIADPRERVLAYVDFRSALIRGELPDFTCLLGTMVQETYSTHPAIRDACEEAILFHARTVAADLEEARRACAPDAGWDALDLALFVQAAIQGAFILAKAGENPGAATRAIAHVRTYLATLLPQPAGKPQDPHHHNAGDTTCKSSPHASGSISTPKKRSTTT